MQNNSDRSLFKIPNHIRQSEGYLENTPTKSATYKIKNTKNNKKEGSPNQYIIEFGREIIKVRSAISAELKDWPK